MPEGWLLHSGAGVSAKEMLIVNFTDTSLLPDLIVPSGLYPASTEAVKVYTVSPELLKETV